MPMTTTRGHRRRWAPVPVVLGLLLQLLGAPGARAEDPTPTGSISAPAPGGTPLGDTSQNAVFGLQPASEAAVDARPFFSFGATPGAKVSDHVALVNIGPTPLTLSVYATDAVSGVDGIIGFPAQDAAPAAAGAWVSVAAPADGVVVPGRSEAGEPGVVILPFSMSVPATAGPGDVVGALIASLRTTGISPNGQTVNLDQRVAMRIYVRVSGDAVPVLAIENLTASFDGTLNPLGRGSVDVSYTIRNTGNVVLEATQTVTVEGLFGGSASADGLALVPPLLPGASVDVRVVIPEVSPMVRLTVTAEVTPVATAVNPTQEVPGPVSASVGVWAVPYPLILILLILGALVWRGIVWSRSDRTPTGGHRAKAMAA